MANKEWLNNGADRLTFGERLGDLISLHGLNGNALAQETGLSQPAISGYLNGTRAPDCASLLTLSRYFSVSADYLLGRTAVASADLGIQEVCSSTGLSEYTVGLLRFYTDPARGFFQDMVNELVKASNDFFPDYLMMRKVVIARSTGKEQTSSTVPDDPFERLYAQWDMERSANKYGYTTLTHEEAIQFFVRNIAFKIEQHLLKEYTDGNN